MRPFFAAVALLPILAAAGESVPKRIPPSSPFLLDCEKLLQNVRALQDLDKKGTLDTMMEQYHAALEPYIFREMTKAYNWLRANPDGTLPECPTQGGI